MRFQIIFSRPLFVKKTKYEDLRFFGVKILLSALCFLLWMVPVIGTYVFPLEVMKYKFLLRLCFWLGSILFVGLGIDQIRVIKRIHLELHKLHSENEELKARLKLMQQQALSLEHLMQVRHDVRAQYNAVMGLAQLGRYEEIKSYISSIYDDLASVDDFPVGISPVLSIVIGQIRKKTREYGIDFEYHITSQDLGMEAKDITGLYFNMLNNAVEAAKISGTEKPYIELEVKKTGNFVYIHCMNSVDTTKLKKRGKRYETTKLNEKYHGLGMEIMENTLKQYNGRMETAVKDGHFVVIGRYACKNNQIKKKYSSNAYNVLK